VNVDVNRDLFLILVLGVLAAWLVIHRSRQ
jgi:hypothetical protein